MSGGSEPTVVSLSANADATRRAARRGFKAGTALADAARRLIRSLRAPQRRVLADALAAGVDIACLLDECEQPSTDDMDACKSLAGLHDEYAQKSSAASAQPAAAAADGVLAAELSRNLNASGREKRPAERYAPPEEAVLPLQEKHRPAANIRLAPASAAATPKVQKTETPSRDLPPSGSIVGRRLEYSFDVNLQPEWFGGEVLCDVGGHWVDVLFDDGDEKCVKIPPASAGAVWRWLEATDEEAATRQTSSPAAKKRLMPRCDASHSGGQSSSHRSRKRKVEDDQGEEESATSSASASQGSLDAAAMGPRSTLRWPEAEVDQLMQMVKEEGPGDWNGKAKRLGDGNRTGNSLSSYWDRMTTTVQRKRSKREPGVWPAPKYPVPTDRRVAKQAAAAAPPCSAARFPLENGRNVRSANKTSVFQVSSTPFPSNILTKDDGLPRQAQDEGRWFSKTGAGQT